MRDWVCRQPRGRRAAFVVLFSLLIACGGRASVYLSLTPVPATQQALFVLLAGALLGSRLGALAAAGYLLMAVFVSPLWPDGTGSTPLTGPLAGFLWSLPLMAYLSGRFVEQARSERPVFFAIGVSAGLAVFDAFGTVRYMIALGLGAAEAFLRCAGYFIGQHAAQGALTVLVASSASSTLQARENK